MFFSTLARYNSLADPYLQSYFSNERIQSHLKRAGLVNKQILIELREKQLV